jgi:hypothetical protein
MQSLPPVSWQRYDQRFAAGYYLIIYERRFLRDIDL